MNKHTKIAAPAIDTTPITARICGAKPGRGWVVGDVVGLRNGKLLVRGRMIHISNVTSGRVECAHVWECDPLT